MKNGLHLSVRVPWQDNGWSGSVCHDPQGNASCVLLPNIGSKRDDTYEQAHAGLPFDQVDAARIPCLDERGTFLSPRAHPRTKEHPYRFNRALATSLRPTTVTIPAYGVHATPFFWLNRSNVSTILNDVDVDYRPEREELVDDILKFKPAWVIHGDNQQALIERFFSDVVPETSLVFFYAKHSPFDGSGPGRRVLVGAARVTGIELPGRWHTDGRAPFPNHMWETSVRHSLRPDGVDGILLPVAGLARLEAEGLDVSPALAWAPEDGGREFSYATEHVSSDTAIAALDRLFQAARRCAEFGLDVPGASLEWVSNRIGELWTTRGPAPGLGAVLSTIGVKYGPMVARKIIDAAPDDVDPWDVLVDALENSGHHTAGSADNQAREIADHLTSTPHKVWQRCEDTRRRALKLLSRFQLTHDQAKAIFTTEHGLDVFLENPYTAYTLLVERPLHVPVEVIDRGCYPSASIRTRFPLDEPSIMADATDPRRVEALLVDVLDEAALIGDTLIPLDRALSALGERVLTEPCPVTEQILRAHDLHPTDLAYDPEVWSPLVGVTMAHGLPAFKLTGLHELAEFIREWLDNQLSIPRPAEPKDMADLVDSVLDAPHPADVAEQRARTEKTEALTELFTAPLSVLNGRAGTGKTTLVKALVKRLTEQGKSVLLLAPTGKARVQLQTKAGHEAKTLAQFLAGHGRYDAEVGYLCDTDRKKAPFYDTIVVDECSMLTEDQLAALLSSLHQPRRLILVGDPRQLPPIGAGRPFVDLITRLTRNDTVPVFPKVTHGYAELTVLRRQEGQTRDDLKLAAWFSGDEIPDGFDEVWQRLRTGDPTPNLAAHPWLGRRPEAVVDHALATQLGITNADDFELSYGGQRNGDWVNFGVGAAAACEDWQILSPTRGHAWGTVEVNRRLKHKHRGQMMNRARKRDSERSVPKPIGLEQIVLGDKVLNNRNQPRRDAFPKGSGLAYVANGEIGVVAGQAGRAGSRPQWTNVEFSSQKGTTYGYRGDDEDDPTLELAWAITIHKSQGSEFGTVFVMLPSAIRRLSREMLYTALTRQQDTVVLLHERPIDDLLDLTSAAASETARRLTDLFVAPDPRLVKRPDGGGGWYDANLIHLTASGVLVRSKNEVIVSRILDDLAPNEWEYEQPLTINGWTRKPDFTIMTGHGRKVYWEHLGMLCLPEYREKWEQKKRWYADGGILPVDQGGGPEGTLMWTDDTDGVDVPGWTAHGRAVIGPSNTVTIVSSRKKKIRRVGG